MKKKLITLVFAILAFQLQSQINLEHKFNWLTYSFNTDAGIRYYLYNSTSSQLTIYNTDYSVFKTLTLSIPTGYTYYGISLISDKLFNTDNSIEFLFSYYGNTTATLYQYCMILYDENLNVLKNFANGASAYTTSNNGVTKLIINCITPVSPSFTYSTEIYSLPGSVKSGVTSLNTSKIETAYPNPAKTIIALPYVLEKEQTSMIRIYKLNGQLVEQKQIDSTFDKVLLNVESYQSGIYLYEYNGISNKFIVN